MGKRGPAKTPTRALQLVGSWRGNARPDEPDAELVDGYPDPPEWLCEAAVEEWHRVVPQLQAQRILATVDLSALAVAVQTFGRLVTAERWIKEHGAHFVIRDKDGRVTSMNRTPAAVEASQLRKDVRTLYREFGLTPSGRAEVAGAQSAAGASASDDAAMFG